MSHQPVPDAPDAPDAIIADLDGVITRTATLHRAAWTETFNALLSRLHPDQPPFTEHDYLDHVDGLPRLDGIRAFLASRSLEFPEGGPRDTLVDGTIRGVGNHKNQRFLQLLGRSGAEVFADAVARIEQWRDAGIPVAVASSSRNCRAILDSAGLRRLFDVQVDGETMAEQDMPGKPAPDLFLEAARQLDAEPGRCAVLEDAIAGVEAGRRGGFGIVVGVDRDGTQADALLARGADLVVKTLDGLVLDLKATADARRGRQEQGDAEGAAAAAADDGSDAPLLLSHLQVLRDFLGRRAPAIFLDFDGTLSPIVARPELAQLAPGMREHLVRLADRFPVVIVSGRDRADVQQRVGRDDLVVAGSHGFDIEGPDGLHRQHEEAEAALPALAAAEADLQSVVDDVDGAQLERKRFGIAVHYRNVADADVPRLETAVRQAVERHDGLRRSTGKKVLEVQPDVAWNKGRAVQWILEALHLDTDAVAPAYVGDDVTDEDAFAALPDRGVGVVVADEPRPTRARWRLRDVDEVGRFLGWMADELPPARGRTATARTGGPPTHD